jgi:hypothetical protein
MTVPKLLNIEYQGCCGVPSHNNVHVWESVYAWGSFHEGQRLDDVSILEELSFPFGQANLKLPRIPLMHG